MKNVLKFKLACILIILSICIIGCGKNDENIDSSEESYDYTATDSYGDITTDNTLSNDVYHLYDQILEPYCNDIGIETSTFDSLNAFQAYDLNLSTIGYSFVDINHNGTQELIIASIDTDETNDNNQLIFEMYSIVDGQPIKVLSSSENNRYYYGDDNNIYNEGSDGQNTAYYLLYRLNNDSTNIELVEGIVYEDYEGCELPYNHIITTPDLTPDTQVTEEFAISKIIEFQNLITPISFTPFSEYH